MALSITHARLLAIAATLTITMLAFWPGLSGGFLFDDYPNIVQKTSVHAADLSVDELSKASAAYQGPIGRPLATISFAINHAIDGLNPWGYKFGGLIIHAFNSLLMLLLVFRLLDLAGYSHSANVTTAFVITAVWAIHPLQVSTVLYVVQRMETLSLTFVLMGLMTYIRARLNQIEGSRAWPWLLASALLASCGLLSKETAVLFPAYTLALELTLLRFRANNERFSRVWRFAYGAGVAAAVALLLLVALPYYGQAELYSVRDFGMLERLLTQLRVLPLYLGWILLPQPASYHFYYDNFLVSQGLFDPVSTFLGGFLLAGLAAVAFATRQRIPLFSLGLMWFFAAHLLTSNIAHLELVFEHRNYFAIIGVVLAIAALLQRLPASEMPQLRTVGMIAIVGGLLLLTLIRSATWGDPTTLAKYLADRNPGSSRASTDLGEQYMVRAGADVSSPFYAMAKEEFERGSRIPDSSPMPEQGLLILAATAGQPANPQWWDRIITKLETRAIGPQELAMITGLLEKRQNGLEFDDGRFADAYLVLVNRMEVPWFQYYAFGEHALLYLKDEALANSLYSRAVEHAADQPDAVAAMVEALEKAGHRRQAQAMADHARELNIADIMLPPAEAPFPPMDETN